MEEVLDSLRKIINRWVNTEALLTEDVEIGDSIIKVKNALRFREGDEVMLTNGSQYEHPLYVNHITDETTIELVSPAQYAWSVHGGGKLKKSIAGKLVQGVYLGDPNTIPRFPAVTVVGDSKNSQWNTLESTNETYEVSISCYVEDSTLEDGYRALMKLTNIIEIGLKRNMFPLVGEKSHADLIQPISSGDIFLKVNSTEKIKAGQMLVLEDQFSAENVVVKSILDETTLELRQAAYYNYALANDPRAIVVSRYLYKCWPKSISYGFVHKDTLLKASKISWTGEEIQMHGPIGWWDTPRN
jgi:hypothetical protein